MYMKTNIISALFFTSVSKQVIPPVLRGWSWGLGIMMHSGDHLVRVLPLQPRNIMIMNCSYSLAFFVPWHRQIPSRKVCSYASTRSAGGGVG
jgi:hypothetical protein